MHMIFHVQCIYMYNVPPPVFFPFRGPLSGTEAEGTNDDKITLQVSGELGMASQWSGGKLTTQCNLQHV